jgi:hypothetical protein
MSTTHGVKSSVGKALCIFLQQFEYVPNGMDVMMLAAAQNTLQGSQPALVPSHPGPMAPQAYLAPVSQYHSVSPQYATSASQFVTTAAPPHYVTSTHHHQAAAGAAQGPPPPGVPHTYATAPQPYQPAGQPGQPPAGQPGQPSPAFVPVSTPFAQDAMGQIVLQMASAQQPLQLAMSQPTSYIQVSIL